MKTLELQLVNQEFIIPGRPYNKETTLKSKSQKNRLISKKKSLADFCESSQNIEKVVERLWKLL